MVHIPYNCPGVGDPEKRRALMELLTEIHSSPAVLLWRIACKAKGLVGEQVDPLLLCSLGVAGGVRTACAAPLHHATRLHARPRPSVRRARAPSWS